jgi:hypothetical protein
MAIGPIDYGSMLTQIDTTPLLQGFQVRDQRRDAQARTAVLERQTDIVESKEQRRQSDELAWKLGMQGVMANPSSEEFGKLALQFPDKVAAIKAASDQQSAAQRTRNVQGAMTVGGLVNAGMYDQAKKFLTERKGALAENGESTEVTDDLIEALDKGDTTRVKALTGLVISGTLGEGAGEVLDTLGYSEKARRDAAKDERDERRADLADKREERMARATDAAIAGRNRDDARADRKAAGGGSKGAGAGSNYEYRVGPDGSLQRRKKS